MKQLAVCLLILGACSRQVPLGYVAGVHADQAQAAVVQVTATDRRHERDPTWIGAVRGHYGTPLKVLHTPRPLADMVAEAFRQALGSRGLLAAEGAGTTDLAVTIVRFQTSQYVRREADLDFVVVLRDRATGLEVYRDEVKSNPVEGHLFALDAFFFGSPNKLQVLAQATMNKAIDTLLDKAAFARMAANDQ